MARIEGGRVVAVSAYGRRSADDDRPLTTETVMYGASLTKAAFAYLVMQLVDERRIDLDTPIAALLPKPLADYPLLADVGADPRSARLTPRHVLSHTSGLANFRWLEPDRRLRFHFDPGSRYAYSGEGFEVLQFAIGKGLGIDVGHAMHGRVFAPLGMLRTSMTWRDDFAADAADTWTLDGRPLRHRRRTRTSAAGSMDTTIADQARFWAAVVRGDGLSPAARAQWFRAAVPITSTHQFPTLVPATAAPIEGFASALGVVAFGTGEQRGWYKGGHDDGTGNLAVCVERGQRCVVLLSNDVRAERLYPELVERILGPTDLPWRWEYAWLDGQPTFLKTP